MMQAEKRTILARCSPADFIGREGELERIREHIASPTDSHCLSLLAAPMAGVSELLRQVYDRAFYDAGGPIPFYFEVADDTSPRDCASRFLREFLLQTVAFRRRDPGIIAASPDICEITELATPADGHWIDRLAETCEMRLSDDRSFIRNCLSAPVRAMSHGAISLVMLDGLHRLADMNSGEALLAELRDIYERAAVKALFAGHRRFLFQRLPFPSIGVEPLASDDAGSLVENLANRHVVAVNDASRDLIAIELDGVPGHIRRLFSAAAEREMDLNSFESVQQVYTDELFGGRIGLAFDRLLDRVLPDPILQDRVVRVLNEAASQTDGRIPLRYLQKHTGIEPGAIAALHHNEIVDVEALNVRFESTNSVLADYIRGRANLGAGESRALVVGETLAAAVKRAPAIMARSYRRGAALGVAELLEAFDGQMVSLALFDYGRFKAELKGAGEDRIIKALREDNEKAALPRIVYVTAADSLYPNLSAIADPERAAVGIGLENDGREVAVLVAEIDSKLEAKADVAEFWLDRMEATAAQCGFSNFRIWLIAPEGFDANALAVLARRGSYGSSRRQAALLARFLNTEIAAEPSRPIEPEPLSIPQPQPQPEPTREPEPEPIPEPTPEPEPEPQADAQVDEYQMTLPMGADSEIVAARAVEDIARRHGIPQRATNQIKTALVEACINAAEHSLSPDQTIGIKLAVEKHRLTITVTNRGVRLLDRLSDDTGNEARRGWGLKLMRSLMDEVRIEPTDDGTRLVMSKTFAPE